MVTCSLTDGNIRPGHLALGGIVVDSFGFEVMFSISLLAGLIATIISLRLEEPRKRNTPVLR